MKGAKEYFMEMQEIEVGGIFSKNLLQEFDDFSTNTKANFVYIKCLKAGKYNLAKKIKAKYGLHQNDDCISAFGLALLGAKNHKNIKTT